MNVSQSTEAYANAALPLTGAPLRAHGRLCTAGRQESALDNPDLPIDFVRELLIARAEGPALATPFVPEGKRD